jgi:hypothetical protein
MLAGGERAHCNACLLATGFCIPCPNPCLPQVHVVPAARALHAAVPAAALRWTGPGALRAA